RHPGQRDVELHRQAVPVNGHGHQRNPGADADRPGLDPAAPGDARDGALEAGGIADGEELLGVRAAAGATEFARYAQIDLERPVRGPAVDLLAPPLDVRLGRVDDAAHAGGATRCRKASTRRHASSLASAYCSWRR